MSNQQRQRTEDFLRQETLKIAKILLPSLESEAVSAAHRRTGLSFLSPALLDVLCAERQELEARRRELEGMPEFQLSPAEAKRTAQEELGRLQEYQAALGSVVQQCQAHPRFQLLLQVGYGTSRYSIPFWRYSFYLDRWAANELCASTGKNDFQTLLDEYQSAEDSLKILQARSQRLSSDHPSPREEWEQCGLQLEKLKASQLSTLQTRIQLALLKGGEVWQVLKASQPGVEFVRLMGSVERLRDQLEDFRGGRR
ncbi:MAG: hypothetical protein KF760_23190 [Candidatus Eremiobacteraeota bacterium]|nr:hypothetical protein [Candidatus Eremiobacteraeota bacterium]MCW5870523.1 hypothetical protein [Candidatus Eremiobacteraeota bacterium]